MNERIVVDVEANAAKFNQGINGVIHKLGGPGTLAIAGAAAAAGAAIAAFAAKGVQEFASLEKGMNEVFTLMPGLTEDAMGSMTQDVQDFAKEMGVLPNDIVPALYDSISAGVPKKNVFDFLEQANMLAIGGVSDLNTAVDGLTSVTNAYGSETLSAADASDIMFTGVKEGKTTIDELSRTVSETAPIAASLGVSFVDTTAALAAMTAQGEPSRKAATKLRQMMAELSDSTKGAGKTLQEITGQDFPAFIAGGGTMQEAIELIADDAEKHGGRVQDEFGSIEAGMAATMLTSTAGRETMGKNMQAMADRSGATAEAYAQMDQGIARTWERMKASMASFMTEIGEALGPTVTKILDGALAAFNDMTTGILGFITMIQENWVSWTEAIRTNADGETSAIAKLFTSMKDAIGAIFTALVTLWNEVLWPVWEAIAPAVEGALLLLTNAVGGAFDIITGVLNTLSALLSGDFTGAWEAMGTMVEKLLDRVEDAFGILWTAVKGTFESMRTYLGNQAVKMLTGWRDLAFAVFDAVEKAVVDWWNAVKETFQQLMTFLSVDLSGAWKGMKATAERIWAALFGWLDTETAGLLGALGAAWGTFNATITAIWESIKATAELIWSALFGWLDTETDTVTATIESVWNSGASALEAVWNGISSTATAIWTGIRSAIEGTLSGLGEWASSIFSDVVDRIGGMVSDVVSRIQDAWDRVTSLFDRADRAERRAADAARETQERIDAIDTSIDEIDSELPKGYDPLAPDGNSGITLPELDDSIMTPDDLPGMASGGIVTSATMALIGEAGPEAVIPLDRLGGMGGNQTVIVELDGRQIMRSVAPRLVDELRLKTGIAGL